MITFKQFMYEMAMHRGAYAEAIKRIGKDVRMGFEFEVFIPEDADVFTPGSSVQVKTTALDSLDTMHLISSYFKMSRAQREQITSDYERWTVDRMDDWIDERWEDYLDSAEAEDYGARTAEKSARRTAKNAYDDRNATWKNWLKTFGSTLEFVNEYDLEPMYGWGDDAQTEVNETQPESQGYMNTWRATAGSLATHLTDLIGDKVLVNGKSPEHWNLVHDTSIKDEHGVDYESGQAGVGVEIVSPPLPFDDAIAALEKVLGFISHSGMQTNETTGLHVNVSIPDLSARIDPLKLILFMGDKHVLKQFDRLTNAFTRSQFQTVVDGVELTGTLPRTVPEIKQAAEEALKTTTKNYSVNLDKLRSGYLEFRAIGGTNYHRRLMDIKNTIGRWILSVEVASDPQKARKEYLKKIVQLLSKTSIGSGK